jgi:leader peptidase (prepilin peptidase) / N-methyltransferase
MFETSRLHFPTSAEFGQWGLVVIAPFIGSFLGVLVRRLPEGRPPFWARSRCDACGGVLAVRDLVPLWSWMAARGRCRLCGQKLGWFYPGIELAATLVALLALVADDGPLTWLDCLFGWWLLALGWTDLRSWLLPDALTLPLVLAGFGMTAWIAPQRLAVSVLGAALGYLGLRLVGWAYRVLRGGEGIGEGDAKLLAASGAWLGVAALPRVILVAASSALVAAIGMRFCGARLGPRSPLPFGPFLALATWLMWLFAR